MGTGGRFRDIQTQWIGRAAAFAFESGSDRHRRRLRRPAGFCYPMLPQARLPGDAGRLGNPSQQPSKGAGNRVHQSRKFTITVASLLTLVGMVLCLLGTGLTQPATGRGSGSDSPNGRSREAIGERRWRRVAGARPLPCCAQAQAPQASAQTSAPGDSAGPAPFTHVAGRLRPACRPVTGARIPGMRMARGP